MENSSIEIYCVDTRSVPVVRVTKWATDPYKDAREVPGDANPRRRRTAAAKFTELGYRKRFELVSVTDSLHIEVKCKNCGNVFTREISCLKKSRSNKSKNANNIKCNNCGITADGTQSYCSSENKRGMDEAVVIDYYVEGNSATQTAKKFGMNLRRVRRIIDEAGVSRDKNEAVLADDYPDVITGDPWLDEAFTCKECGRVFTRQQYMIESGRTRAINKAPNYCSKNCSCKMSSRKARHNRKLLERASGGDTIPLGDLIERDHGICQICGEKVDIHDGYFDEGRHFHSGPLYPTVDHIIPLSKGGANTWDNVQLAHLSCNGGKCDSMPEDVSAQAKLLHNARAQRN